MKLVNSFLFLIMSTIGFLPLFINNEIVNNFFIFFSVILFITLLFMVYNSNDIDVNQVTSTGFYLIILKEKLLIFESSLFLFTSIFEGYWILVVLMTLSFMFSFSISASKLYPKKQKEQEIFNN